MLAYSKYSKALGVLFAISVLTTGACGSKSESADAGCQPGAEHCSCLSNGECNAGLICATNLNQCVRLVTTGSGGDATGSGGSGSGGPSPTRGTTRAGGGVGARGGPRRPPAAGAHPPP